MISRKKITLAGFCALAAFGAIASNANAAATVFGGPVSASMFAADNITSGIFSYLGSSTSVFTASGTGTLTIASSTYADTFGYAKTNYTSPVVVFADAVNAPATAVIAPNYTPFVFYFSTGGSGTNGNGSDSAATLYSDGHTNGTDGGQANLAIYESTTGEYVFFFDDGGPSGCSNTHGDCIPNDDNDYNDMVVTYKVSAVPEPTSMALLGAGLLGTGVMARRRRQLSPTSTAV